MSNKAKYVKETFWAIASKGAAFIFYYALVYYLLQKLTVERWGEWSAFLALLNVILLISELGISAASKRYVAQARDTVELGGIVRVSLTLRIIASGIYVLLIALLVRPLLTSLGQPEYVDLMQRALLLIAFYGVTDYFKNLFEALHRLRFTFVVNLFEYGLKFLLALVLFQNANQFAGIVNAFTIATGVALLAGALLTFRTVPSLFASSAPPKFMRQVYFYSIPVFLMTIGALVALEIDTIMLRHLRTAYDTGIYATAKNVVMFLPHISVALSMGIIPGLVVFDAAAALGRRQAYYRILVIIVGLYMLIDLGVVAFALFGLNRLFNNAYAAASVPLLALTPFVLFSGISSFCGSLLDYRGLAWLRAINFSFTIIANVLLNWWWIPKWGAVGAAAASSVAFAPYCALNLWQAHAAFAKEDGAHG
ncbi:MAG: hypothetical protein QOI04_2305 [Verrucomicrobiota bacterium]|jgi:O-antigen/teichoic acid export membrane protein